MANTLSLPHTVVEAARIAAPVFQQEEWMYSLDESGTSHIPLEGEIAEAIQRRIDEANNLGRSTGGRFLVESDPMGTTIYLRLGVYDR